MEFPSGSSACSHMPMRIANRMWTTTVRLTAQSWDTPLTDTSLTTFQLDPAGTKPIVAVSVKRLEGTWAMKTRFCMFPSESLKSNLGGGSANSQGRGASRSHRFDRRIPAWLEVGQLRIHGQHSLRCLGFFRKRMRNSSGVSRASQSPRTRSAIHAIASATRQTMRHAKTRQLNTAPVCGGCA